MADKLDTSPEEEAIKDEARQFMNNLVVSSEGDDDDAATSPTAKGTEKIQAWKEFYQTKCSQQQTTTEDDGIIIMSKFWSLYDPNVTSIWTMTYDEADSNENLDETIDIVNTLVNEETMESIRDDCFGIVHTLESLELEGLWFFNGPDPELLFGANEETSWYTFAQLGPEATDLVQVAVANLLTPTDGKFNGKVIQDTKVFC
mmetsp:Transcript_32801/g.49445  ORF Transcript_32801/g.49445 Transcript_32801/m.49445 type:complete len:202 (+) Transcript_32801:72-677(+)